MGHEFRSEDVIGSETSATLAILESRNSSASVINDRIGSSICLTVSSRVELNLLSMVCLASLSWVVKPVVIRPLLYAVSCVMVCSYAWSNSIYLSNYLLANFQGLVPGCIGADFCRELPNTRWKTLDEIYRICIPLHLSDRKNSANFRHEF